MSRPLRSGATLSALIRTAKWSLDNAQMAHADAVKLQDAAQQALQGVIQQLDELDQYVRNSLNGGVMNVTTLQHAHLTGAHLRDRVLECETELRERSKHVDETYRTLLATKARHELYERLRARRERLQAHTAMQQRQRRLDELGTVRVATHLPGHLGLSGEESSHDH